MPILTRGVVVAIVQHNERHLQLHSCIVQTLAQPSSIHSPLVVFALYNLSQLCGNFQNHHRARVWFIFTGECLRRVVGLLHQVAERTWHIYDELSHSSSPGCVQQMPFSNLTTAYSQFLSYVYFCLIPKIIILFVASSENLYQSQIM